MKKNWIKGLDRIAILLAIPIAVYGFFYTVKKYSEKKAVYVYYTESDDIKAKKRYEELLKRDKEAKLWCQFRTGGPFKMVLGSGRKGLKQAINSCFQLEFALNRAIKSGGDPEGTLVNKQIPRIGYKEFGLFLIPRKSKRYTVGMGGAISFALIVILFVGIVTRFVPRLSRWIKEGFK